MTGMSLRVDDFCAGYGRTQVLNSVSVKADAGSLVTIIGANGAGKSTLLNAIMGVLPSKGSVALDDRPIGLLPLEQRVVRGMCLVPERRELFNDLSVEDNLRLGAFRRKREERQPALEAAFAMFPKLKERRAQIAGTLSGGERQMLAMGRALMAKPKLLMLDEPSLGLAPLIVREIFHTLTGLRQSGVTVLLVEQNARAALQVADYAYVMELGSITAQGTPSEIEKNSRLIDSYLGLGGKDY
ncbi:MAG: ABC transporter ATP-binding protein [Pseudorhodoplanes sp.]